LIFRHLECPGGFFLADSDMRGWPSLQRGAAAKEARSGSLMLVIRPFMSRV